MYRVVSLGRLLKVDERVQEVTKGRIPMKGTRQMLIGALGVAAITLAGAAGAAEPPRVSEVMHWSEDNNPATLNALIKKGVGIMQKVGCGCTVRVWVRAFGGDAGVTIVTEYPSLLALAQFEEKLRNSPEWTAFMTADVMTSGTKPPTVELVSELML